MNKLLLLSCIKGLLFVLKPSTEYKLPKKGNGQSFCSRFKIYVLMVSKLGFAFKIIRHIIFLTVKKVSFPQSRNVSTVKEIFHNQGTFPKSRNISTIKHFFTIKELFYSRGNFPQSRKFSTKKFT